MPALSEASFCWHCGGQLKASAFSVVTDQIGNRHRVHKICEEDASAECTQITAQESVDKYHPVFSDQGEAA